MVRSLFDEFAGIGMEPATVGDLVSPGAMSSNDEAASSKVLVPVVIAICISYSLTSLGLHRFKEVYGYALWAHESSLACVAGLICGGLVKMVTGRTIEFNNNVFFYMVLPPIIFSAGITLKHRKFFRYIYLISLFGVVGTFINFVLITAVTYKFQQVFEFRDVEHDGLGVVQLSWTNCMILAAVLSGTDEVSALSLMPMRDYPRLGALIFGEGVLNDAISIVLFHSLVSARRTLGDLHGDDLAALARTLVVSVTNEVFFSLVIGAACGAATAAVFNLSIIAHHPVHQSALLLLFAYLAYAVAEAADVSGIMTLFVCAVTQSQYAWDRMAHPAQVGIQVASVALSDIAEGFAFSYVGLSMWEYTDDGGFHLQVGRCFRSLALSAVVAVRTQRHLTHSPPPPPPAVSPGSSRCSSSPSSSSPASSRSSCCAWRAAARAGSSSCPCPSKSGSSAAASSAGASAGPR